jgi:hypothetical protein
MKPIDYRDWPKPTVRRHCTVVAEINDDFDALAERLGAQPKIFTQRASKESPRLQSRACFFLLSNRAPGAFHQDLDGKSHIELLLPVVKQDMAFLSDYDEVVSFLKPKQIYRWEGNLTWLPDRTAKRVRPKEEPLPEDWWNHIRALTPEENAKRKGFK